jgi:hypothetical protein
VIALDSRGRVFVGDRNNNRIQIFDQEGNFLDMWYQFGRPNGIVITRDDRIYVADSESYDFHNLGWEKGTPTERSCGGAYSRSTFRGREGTRRVASRRRSGAIRRSFIGARRTSRSLNLAKRFLVFPNGTVLCEGSTKLAAWHVPLASAPGPARGCADSALA